MRGQALKAALALVGSGAAFLLYGSGRLPEWLMVADDFLVDWLRGLF